VNTKEKGELVEARTIAKLSEFSIDIFLPFGENTRADMIISSNNGLERIQIKGGWIKDGSVRFNCSKVNSNTTGSTRSTYDGDVEAFIIHCPENNGYYHVPIEKANSATMWLRIDESMGDNGKVKWAKDFQLSDKYSSL